MSKPAKKQEQEGPACPRCKSYDLEPLSLDRGSSDALHARCKACTFEWLLPTSDLIDLWYWQGSHDEARAATRDSTLARVLSAWPLLKPAGRRVLALMADELLGRHDVVN